jgi:hypothetical protein
MENNKTGCGELSSKLFTVLSCVMFSSFVYANEIYIDQIGDSTNITITQDGDSNTIGTASTEVKINGDGNTVAIDQIGSNNTLSMEIGGGGASVTTSATGSYNNQEINCADCNNQTITSMINGDYNNTTQSIGGTGGGHSNIAVTGDYNTITHTTTGAGAHTADIVVNRSGLALTPNLVSVTQSGASAQSATVNAAGSDINISITQSSP